MGSRYNIDERSENITENRAHIGVIRGNVAAMEESITGATTEETEGMSLTKTVWNEPVVYVDDGCFGTLHINERMGLTTYLNIDDESDSNEWLPCKCQAEWNDMDLQSEEPLR